MSQFESRRQFFKFAVAFSGLALLAPKSVLAEEKRRAKPSAGGGDADLPLIEPGKGLAANLNYQHKNTDIKDAALKTDRTGVPFAKQQCSGCMLYAPAGKKNGEDVGKCTLFNGQLVKASGWCTSWAKKA